MNQRQSWVSQQQIQWVAARVCSIVCLFASQKQQRYCATLSLSLSVCIYISIYNSVHPSLFAFAGYVLGLGDYTLIDFGNVAF